MITKHVLKNGLTVIIKPINNIPKVSTQLWYNVGSKNEKTSQKGIAHLIEHMIFKGTNTLSESDINMITHKLSGICNAFTSYDYTGYLFDFPSQNWKESLVIMSDSMKNCTFKQDMLNSELKAVIQELKMYKDNYLSSITEQLLSSIFPDHPYHHPIIGYKQDLWNLDRQNLVDFYKEHYIPNNSTLVVVGDVEVDEVIGLAEQYFGYIEPNWDYKKENFYHGQDLTNCSLKIYRDIKQPLAVVSWVVPGASAGKDYFIELVCSIIASGKGSRLYKKLVDTLELVVEIEAFTYDLFDYGLLLIYFEPKNISDIDLITNIINEELNSIIDKGVLESEIVRAIKKTEIQYLGILENHQKIAYNIGKYYLATGNHEYFEKYLDYNKDNLGSEVREFTKNYLKTALMSLGQLLPIDERDQAYWLKLQEISDQEDSKVLFGKERKSEIEAPKWTEFVKANPPKPFKFAQSKKLYLNNGLKVLYGHNTNLPKIDLILDFKAKHYYDPEDLQGLCSFVNDMLLEGTTNYTASSFADTLESYGITLNANPGSISMSMLAVDLPKGLELLNEILTQAVFAEKNIEKVRAQKIAEIQVFLDSPTQIARDILDKHIYKSHPYHKNSLGTVDSINKIKRQDLIDFYKNYLSPKGASLSIVGDLERYELKKVLEHMLNSWQGPEVKTLDYPIIEAIKPESINYPIVRDQVVLVYGGLSVERLDPDYDKLLIFDQIFTGGVLGSMSSKLFDLRERSGLFYTIGGSLILNADKQPGIILIKTIVSNDRLLEAEREISNAINTAIENITKEEFEEAKSAIINSLVNNFASNIKTAAIFLAKDFYEFPDDYFDKRAESLDKITIKDMQMTVKKYLNTDKLITVRVGRV